MSDRPDDRADVIEAAVRVIDRTLAEQGGYAPKHFARALSAAGLLVSPADQDELCDLCRLFQVALRRESEAHLKSLAEADLLRAQVAAVRAELDREEARSILRPVMFNGEPFPLIIEVDIIRAALDTGEKP